MIYTAFIIKRGWYILTQDPQNRDEEAETYLATNVTCPPYHILTDW